MEKPLEMVWVGLQIDDVGSQNHQSGATSVSQVGGDSDMAAACVYILEWERAQQREN